MPEDPCQPLADELADLKDQLQNQDELLREFLAQQPPPTSVERADFKAHQKELPQLIQAKQRELTDCREHKPPPHSDPCQPLADELADLKDQLQNQDELLREFLAQQPPPTSVERADFKAHQKELPQLIQAKQRELTDCREGRTPPPKPPLPPLKLKHVFVVALENRSFDHTLGFADIHGTDAVTGMRTSIENLSTLHTNEFRGISYAATNPAHYVMPHDPPHEYESVRDQLCGPYQLYNGPQSINNSGFAFSYATSGGTTVQDPAEVMRCFSIEQLPILTTLACEFTVCDHWFSSMPGPTWPNRFFLHAASSGGLDHSPSNWQIISSIATHGYSFDNGTIYDRLDANGIDWAIYTDDYFPQVLAISGMDPGVRQGRFHAFEDFQRDVFDPEFSPAYVFIEPNYGFVLTHSGNMKCGNSEHPTDDITRGERFLKSIYETIRNSPHWEESLLVITYDEHGGFYDHVPPPAGVPPGDSVTDDDNNIHGFKFDQLGVRVPTILVSPLIPRNIIDKTTYDHTSLLATVERIFHVDPLTRRDRAAADFLNLFTLVTARTDAPVHLPEAAVSGIDVCREDEALRRELTEHEIRLAKTTRQFDDVSSGFSFGFAQIALRRDLHISPPQERESRKARFREVRTNFDVALYLREVRQRIERAKLANPGLFPERSVRIKTSVESNTAPAKKPKKKTLTRRPKKKK